MQNKHTKARAHMTALIFNVSQTMAKLKLHAMLNSNWFLIKISTMLTHYDWSDMQTDTLWIRI